MLNIQKTILYFFLLQYVHILKLRITISVYPNQYNQHLTQGI